MAIMVQISELILRDEDQGPIFEDLHFRLYRGEWASVVGPDGAGKTAVVLGVHHAVAVAVACEGPDRLRDLRQRIGIVPHNPPTLHRQTLMGALVFVRRALGASRSDAAMKAQEVLALVDLNDLAHRAVDELDELERQRFQLALTLSHDPVLLLLDDPLSDLEDPQRRRYLQLLERLHLRRRLSILLTTSNADAIQDAPSSTYRLQNRRLHPLSEAAIAASTVIEETSE